MFNLFSLFRSGKKGSQEAVATQPNPSEGVSPVADVVIYTSKFCPFCTRAKSLLNAKGVNYQEIDIMMDPLRRKEMLQKSNGSHTVPQIFINEEHIGGCDDLLALNSAGNLDPKLKATG